MSRCVESVTSPRPREAQTFPLPGDTSCTPHSADWEQPLNFRISLSELLRIIQFFNSIGYFACPGQGTEDGFCIGIP